MWQPVCPFNRKGEDKDRGGLIADDDVAADDGGGGVH